MVRVTKGDVSRIQSELDRIDLLGGPNFPRGLLFSGRPDMSIYTFGGQNLIWKLRHADAWMHEEVRQTHHKVGQRLVRDALFFLGDDASGTVGRNVAYEVSEVGDPINPASKAMTPKLVFSPTGKNYRMYFGLTHAWTTQGNQAVGAKPMDVASHGIFLERGTGIFGAHKRRTAKMRGNGMRPRPYLSPSLAKNDLWIDKQYTSLGNRLGAYLGRTGPVGRRV